MRILNKKRYILISWLILPILFIWMAIGYLIGFIIKQPDWDKSRQSNIVSSFKYNDPLPLPEYKREKYKWSRKGLVTLWFDDGWLSEYTIAYPYMQKYGYKGAIAITTGYVGSGVYVNWFQVKNLQVNGWEITAHSRTHDCSYDKTQTKRLKDELVGSLADLRNQGLYVEQYVTPCGEMSKEMVAIASQYFTSFRTSDSGINPIPVIDRNYLYANTIKVNTPINEIKKLLDDTYKQKGWIILMFHQLDNGNAEYSISKQKFELILQTIKSSGLEVVVPTQALQI